MRVVAPVISQIVAPKKAVAMKKVCIQNNRVNRNHWFTIYNNLFFSTVKKDKKCKP